MGATHVGEHEDRRPAVAVPAFTAVSRTRLCEEVAARIQDLIVEGTLKPGDKLPPERELVRRFEVSRSSVREALRTLELMGLVRSRQGGGTSVADASPKSLMIPLSSVLARHRNAVGELMEARRILEPPIAGRAAAQATKEDVQYLDDVLRRQRAKMLRGESTVPEDSEFHYGIAVAARNGALRTVVEILMQLLRDSRTRSLAVKGRVEHSYAGHRRVWRAIARGDPEAAERQMRRHLDDIEALILKSI